MRDEPKQILTPEHRDYFDSLGEEAVLSALDNREYNPGLQSAAFYWLRERQESREKRTNLRFRIFAVGVILVGASIVTLIFAAVVLTNRNF